jgi:type II secretory pathway component PulF
MIRGSHTATFLEMLALLVQNQTPLPEAVTLAGDASGDPGTIHAARQMAHALQDGQSPTASDRSTFPPLVKWLLLCSGRENVLLPAIQHAAASYHRRARYQSDMLRLFLPVILTVLVGGLVTAVYALALCIPYVLLLHSLAW